MDYKDSAAEADFNRNSSGYSAPGQGDSDGWGDIFSSDDTRGSSSVEPTTSGGVNTPQIQGSGQNPMNPMNQKSAEDMAFDIAVGAGKGIYRYIRAMVNSLKDNKEEDWHNLGINLVKSSIGFCVVGGLFSFINVFLKSGNTPLDLVIGSLMSFSVGVGLCMFNDASPSVPREVIPQGGLEPASVSEEDMGNLFGGEETEVDYPEPESGLEEYDPELGIGGYDPSEDGLDGWGWSDNESVESAVADSESFNPEEAVNSIREITPGTQTRAYLYEEFTKVLPNINPGFSEMQQIPQCDEEFEVFRDMLNVSSEQIGLNVADYPELLEVMYNDFIIRLNCTRPKGNKEAALAKEIASCYERDEYNRVVYEGVYATIETSPGRLSINIFKGSGAGSNGNVLISLKDIYDVVQDYILDLDTKMPFVWGVDEFGNPLICDLKDCHSMIISGEPDGGKSWKGQSICMQLAMFHSPKELEFYILDPKNEQSDYLTFAKTCAHVRYFCGDITKVVEGLKAIIDYVENVRKKLLAESECDKIEDYNKKNPNDKMPYMYIVIDEMISVATMLQEGDKDSYKLYKNYLNIIVSQYRFVGVRLICFPHRILDNVIPKTTYALISSRAVVRQLDADEIKTATGATPKEFPYKLANRGDMALKTKDIARGNVKYCHAEVVTTSIDSNKNVFKYIGGVWQKLEPDCKPIEIKKYGGHLIGGKIGNNYYGGSMSVQSSIVKEDSSRGTPAPDNTSGLSSFKYESMSTGSNVDDLLDFFGTEDSQGMENGMSVDDPFWDNL